MPRKTLQKTLQELIVQPVEHQKKSNKTSDISDVDWDAFKESRLKAAEERLNHSRMLLKTTTPIYDEWWFYTTKKNIYYRDFPGKPGVATWREITPVSSDNRKSRKTGRTTAGVKLFLTLNLPNFKHLQCLEQKKFGQVKRRLIRSKTSVNAESERLDVSASKKKIEKSEGSFKDYEDNFSVDTQSRYVIIDLNMLNDIFNNIAKCRYCDKSFCFDVAENKSSRKGLATNVSATCTYCGSGHTSMTSNTVSDGYEVNLRFVYGMRCIGIGKSAAQIFCALMNLPPPPAKFERLYTPIFKALETVSSRSMVNSVNKAVIENEHNKNIAIALDGTWQKRGHTSKNGVVTATSLDNGKVIDFNAFQNIVLNAKVRTKPVIIAR
ncbi:uncharacterized protein TNCV_1474661 [Trichonephila clavipes]|nr:uncharacterized protein TNCV_1474661 [Trichonephila clavipes]